MFINLALMRRVRHTKYSRIFSIAIEMFYGVVSLCIPNWRVNLSPHCLCLSFYEAGVGG